MGNEPAIPACAQYLKNNLTQRQIVFLREALVLLIMGVEEGKLFDYMSDDELQEIEELRDLLAKE